MYTIPYEPLPIIADWLNPYFSIILSGLRWDNYEIRVCMIVN